MPEGAGEDQELVVGPLLSGPLELVLLGPLHEVKLLEPVPKGALQEMVDKHVARSVAGVARGKAHVPVEVASPILEPKDVRGHLPLDPQGAEVQPASLVAELPQLREEGCHPLRLKEAPARPPYLALAMHREDLGQELRRPLVPERRAFGALQAVQQPVQVLPVAFAQAPKVPVPRAREG
jgi:hypothetical protein